MASIICDLLISAVSTIVRTGEGKFDNSRRASIPELCGITRSSRSTSGLSCRARFTASVPLAASPTTRNSGSASSTLFRPSLKIGSSSAIRILIIARKVTRKPFGESESPTEPPALEKTQWPVLREWNGRGLSELAVHFDYHQPTPEKVEPGAQNPFHHLQ